MMLCPSCRRAMRAPVYRVGPLVLDMGAHRLTVDGEEVHVPGQQMMLLRLLMERPGQVVSYQTIWHEISEDAERQLVFVVLSKLRKRLGEHGEMIRTVWHEGLLLSAPAEQDHDQ